MRWTPPFPTISRREKGSERYTLFVPCSACSSLEEPHLLEYLLLAVSSRHLSLKYYRTEPSKALLCSFPRSNTKKRVLWYEKRAKTGAYLGKPFSLRRRRRRRSFTELGRRRRKGDNFRGQKMWSGTFFLFFASFRPGGERIKGTIGGHAGLPQSLKRTRASNAELLKQALLALLRFEKPVHAHVCIMLWVTYGARAGKKLLSKRGAAGYGMRFSFSPA